MWRQKNFRRGMYAGNPDMKPYCRTTFRRRAGILLRSDGSILTSNHPDFPNAFLQMAGLYTGTYMRDCNGIIIGFPCEELGRRMPDGVAEYYSESQMPWVRTEYGCDIWNGE